MEAVIFDLDGVLCSTDEFHYKAWKKISDEKSLFFNRALNERLRGIGRKESYRIILDENKRIESDNEIEKAIKKKNELYRSYLSMMDESYVSQDVINLLTELNCRKIKIAVGSSSKNAKYIMKKIGLDKYFECIVDGTMISLSKPNPEVFLLAATMLKVKAYSSIVVEDAESGVKAALLANMIALAYKQPNLNIKNDRLFQIDNLSEVLKYIDKY